MSEQPPPPPDEPPPRRACPICDGSALDAQDLAILSYVAGVVSLVLAIFAAHHGLVHFLALPLGLLAIAAGYKSSKVPTPKQKMAERGLTYGALGIAFYLAIATCREAVRLLFG